ncbi:glycoside hydrolase family 16 protein [Nocardioides immobilis]|uniref:Glycoside hydrolase family 16 protein n=1 Tax=Nocardioides immobilis TaxID=2049295 RepID=A0A417Y2X5_9ACTN|nr:glycoside hydrolase family 16 protein [Nocardioides immobilis]RHW26894.1 glycoside hydrolase family 16 protein [Nocardioides immobilis]
MRKTVGTLQRLLIGATLVGAAALAPLPAGAPTEPAAASVLARDACGPILKKWNGTRWRCSFVDNFNGRQLDRDKWGVQESQRSRFSTGMTCYMDSPKNIKVRQGKLRLITLKRSWLLCGAYKAFITRFTGGMIGTKGHFSQTYGRFEIRAKFPPTKEGGLHGGFWMYPIEKTYGQWPESGEMDVAEWWSYTPHVVLSALHYDGRTKAEDSSKRCRTRTPARFHRYSVLWRPTMMRFYIDGRECFRRAWEPDAPQKRPQPFDHPFSMILNMGVTEYTRDAKITNKTEFPSAFVVDYAKAWR